MAARAPAGGYGLAQTDGRFASDAGGTPAYAGVPSAEPNAGGTPGVPSAEPNAGGADAGVPSAEPNAGGTPGRHPCTR